MIKLDTISRIRILEWLSGHADRTETQYNWRYNSNFGEFQEVSNPANDAYETMAHLFHTLDQVEETRATHQKIADNNHEMMFALYKAVIQDIVEKPEFAQMSDEMKASLENVNDTEISQFLTRFILSKQ